MEKLADRIKRRRDTFENLEAGLGLIKKAAVDLDPHAEVYLFGSTASTGSKIAGDIDVLIVTEMKPDVVITHFWKMGFSDPFEFHVRTADQAAPYFRRDNPRRIQ
ncbi:hypothetical protein IX51_01280 [uncultured archaeon]|nr:hypothetical protein IX51_01280 [uncultured archaeon]